MSHYTVTVVVKDPSDLEAALAPFDENGTWFAEGSRWDWWVVGGRWSGMLRVKGSAEPVDVARKRDVDWDAVGAAAVESSREFYRYLKDGGFTLGEGIRDGETEDEFVRRVTEPFATHAFLDLDGEWHESGRMGWFGMVLDGEDETDTWTREYQRLLRDVPDDAYIIVVDAHV